MRGQASVAGGAAARDPGGPRFALRFSGGVGQLQLARPLKFGLGTVDELHLDLGPLRFPLDLSAGAGRFRTRRTRVRSARVRVDLPTLLSRQVQQPLSLTALAPCDGGLSFALEDAFGTIAFDARARFEGARLRVLVASARAVREGPAPPLVRAVVAAREMGLGLEEARGALSVDRALSMILMEALVPHGWRIPDDRSVRLDLTVLGSRRVLIRTLAGDEPEQAAHSDWARARALAPVMAQLALGDREAAGAELAGLLERQPATDASELGFGAPSGANALSYCASLRGALRAGDLDAAAAAAEALEAVEPCDAVAVEGLCLAADLAMPSRPRLAASLLERACARGPSDARNALRLIEAATRLGDVSALTGAIERGLESQEPGPARGAFAREAASLCELSGHPAAADALFFTAYEWLPEDARALKGLGRARARAGNTDGALDAFDRAAARYEFDSDPASRAEALYLAASQASLRGDAAAAEVRLTQASELRPSGQVWAALARARRALGDHPAMVRAEDHLLASIERAPHVGEEVLTALADGVRSALERGRLERAKSWHAALARCSSEDPSLPLLAAQIEDAQLAGQIADPAQLFHLSGEQRAEVLSQAEDVSALLREAIATCEDVRAAAIVLESTASERGEPLDPSVAEALLERVDEVRDPELWLRLARWQPDLERREQLLIRARRQFLDAERPAQAALAQAQLGALKRDTTMIRAALTTAERAGAVDVARQVVQLALGVVGDGPARASLEAVWQRLHER